MTDKCTISVVIPAYNSEKILPELLRQLADALPEICGSSEYEVIIINDGSRDKTWSVLCDLTSIHAWLRIVNLRKNSGQHNALLAGMRLARGDVVVLMDDDLQHSPNDIRKLFDEMVSDVDVCYASFKEKKHAKWKVLGSRFNDWTAERLIGKPVGIRLSSFKAMRRDVAEEVIKYSGPFPYVDGLLLAVTSNIVNVEASHHERYVGQGNYSFFESIFLWTKMAINFSVVPLRIASFIGVVFAVLGLIAALGLVGINIIGTSGIDVPGWSSIVVLILFISGVQLIALGAIGEYLGRSYVHLNGKPQYLIREKIGFDKAEFEQNGRA